MIYLNDHIEELNLPEALQQLSEQRRQQALRFRHDIGRRTAAAAYLLLCEGLRSEYGIAEPPQLAYEEGGKPLLKDYPHIHFNLSHCRQAAVCVVSSQPVGVDIERIRPYKESLVRYTMNDSEQQLIAQSDRPDVEFIRLWTMKEAVLKLTGEGIRRNLRTVLQGGEQFHTVVNEEKGYVYSIIYGNNQQTDH